MVKWIGVVSVFFLAACHKPTTQEESAKVDPPKVRKVTIAEIEEGIKAYIQQKTEEGNGYFSVKDNDNTLQMKLVRVHTEYLSNLGPKSHFACVDLADVSGDVYDVDFFLEGEPGQMDVTETSVHKLNGKPFYAWKQRADKTWHRVPVKEASTRLLGVIEGSDAFEFYYSVFLPEITSPGEIWIPMASSDEYQTIELLSLKAPTGYQILREEKFGNTVLYAKVGPANSNQSLEVRYRVQRLEKSPYVESKEVAPMYLQANNTMPVGGRFAEIAKETFGSTTDKLMQARMLYDYVIDNMRYMKYGAFGQGDANYACDAKTGNCSEFHSFFISLARSAGIPARFAIGASIPSERNEGGIDGYHCWAEFYAEGKWWPIDISEGNKYTPLATYYFGHHPANRIELSRGRDLVLEPGPKAGPINFFAYPVLEVGGKPVMTQTIFSFERPTAIGD